MIFERIFGGPYTDDIEVIAIFQGSIHILCAFGALIDGSCS